MTEIARQMGIRVKLDGIQANLEEASQFYKAVDLKLWLHSYPAAKKFHPILGMVALPLKAEESK